MGLALFAFAWAIVRASVQAVTGDEAATYVFFVARHDPYQWFPAANNHLLNSLLMRGFVSVFGVSHLTVRAPALIGAFLYITAAFWLSKLVSFRWSVRLPLFVCLVYNPFIFDFLVAARGYGMAAAFLMWAIAFPAWCYLDPGAASPKRLILACGAASACLALSFAASFTFAFVNTLSLLALLVWALGAARVAGPEGQRRLRGRLVAAAILPGLALTVLLPSYTLLHWPKGQLFFGGTSIWETITSVIQASLYQLNPHLLNPLLYPVLAKTRNLLVPTICGIAVVEACLLLVRRWRPGDARSCRLATLGVTVAGIAVFSLLIHWLSLRVFGLLLPGGRTALYLAPLLTLSAGVLASITLPSRAGGIPRRALTVMLFVLGFYYVFCLRLTHFKEWQYQEDVEEGL